MVFRLKIDGYRTLQLTHFSSAYSPVLRAYKTPSPQNIFLLSLNLDTLKGIAVNLMELSANLIPGSQLILLAPKKL